MTTIIRGFRATGGCSCGGQCKRPAAAPGVTPSRAIQNAQWVPVKRTTSPAEPTKPKRRAARPLPDSMGLDRERDEKARKPAAPRTYKAGRHTLPNSLGLDEPDQPTTSAAELFGATPAPVRSATARKTTLPDSLGLGEAFT